MEYDATGFDLELMLRSSPDICDFVQDVADQGADRWRQRSRRRTGFNAEHVEAFTEPGPDGTIEGVVHATGHYARYREHGTRYNQPEHVMRDFIHDVDG
jgi:hypothetical protein